MFTKSLKRGVTLLAVFSIITSLVPVTNVAAQEAPRCTVVSNASVQEGGADSSIVERNPVWFDITGASWIWGDADNNVSTTTQTFSKRFIVNGTSTAALLTVAADNGYSVKVNGSSAGDDKSTIEDNFRSATEVNILSKLVMNAENLIEITVTNFDVTGINPAGLAFKIAMEGNTCDPLPPPDLCSNITGLQNPVPRGYELVSGKCVPTTITVGTMDKSCITSNENLLTNGSFEVPAIIPSYSVVSSVTGWISSVLTNGFEIWRGQGGPASAGDQHLELDVNIPTTITQSVATEIGNQYKVTLDFSPRSGGNAPDNKVEVAVGGVLGSVSADGSVYPANVWTTHNFLFTAATTSSLLELRDMGNSNGLGTLIDNVKVCLVTDNTPDGTIKGFKFNDSNADGVFTNDESKLANWDIVLTDSEGNEKFATTNSVGEYIFDVKSGSYTVTETQQKGWEQTATLVSTGSTVVGNACKITVTKDGGEIGVGEGGGFEGSFGPQTYTCDFGNRQIDEEEPRRSGGGGGTRVGDRNPRTPTGEVLGASTSTPTGVVLGDATSTMPVGAPNTGAGGAAPLTVSLPTLVAILSTTTRKSK